MARVLMSCDVGTGVKKRLLQRCLQANQYKADERHPSLIRSGPYHIYCWVCNLLLDKISPLTVCFNEHTRVVEYFSVRAHITQFDFIGSVSLYHNIVLNRVNYDYSFWKGVREFSNRPNDIAYDTLM